MTLPKSQKTHLRVPNFSNFQKFITAAREVWDKHHKPTKRGPEPEKNRILVFKCLDQGMKEEEVTSDMSLDKLTDYVKNQVGTYPHRDTVYKYAKMWRFKKRGFKVSLKECLWIQKYSTHFFDELKNVKQKECQEEIDFIGSWFMSLRQMRRRPDLNDHNTFDWEKEHIERIKADYLVLGPLVLGKGLYRKLERNLEKLKPLIYDPW